MIPKHYDKPITPWCLQKHMESSGSTFVDARRTDAIEYCFRMKGDLLGDLKKAYSCILAAIQELEKIKDEKHCTAFQPNTESIHHEPKQTNE